MYLITQLMNVTVVVTLSALIYISISDIKSKKISMIFILMLSTFGIVNKLLAFDSLSHFSLDLLGMIIGTGLLLTISKLTKEQLGYGDGLIFLMLSALMSWQIAVTAFILAFVFCGIFGLVLIAISRKRKGQSIPFVPFVMIAFMILMFVR